MMAARGPDSPFDLGTGVCFGLGQVVYDGGHEWRQHSLENVVSAGKARRALELLVDQLGTTEALMLAHGFTDRMLGRLVLAGLTAAQPQVIKTGGEAIEVGRIRITNVGRRVIES